jgi:hypothetical protein
VKAEQLVGVFVERDEAGERTAEISGARIKCPQWRKVRLQARRSDLKHADRREHVP